MDQPPHQNHSHFKGKDALGHVAEAQAQGILASTEMHGEETPGRVVSGCDAARDSGLFLGLLAIILYATGCAQSHAVKILWIAAFCLLLWKAARSAWLGWSRLERLHRVVAQEKWEIEHNRQQERDELRVLYAAKGFQGKLLEEVLDVLMADGDRLLKVMVQEELGLTLEAYEHPLLQSLGAAVGVLLAAIVVTFGGWIENVWGVAISAFFVIGFAACVSSYYAGNRLIPAVVWNIGIATVAFGSLHFLLQYFQLYV